MPRLIRTAALFFLCQLATISLSAQTPGGGTEWLEGLEWRLVGPYRGGRVTAVTGVRGKPNLYYMGATGGGVW
ncbi:MAG: hypothetical protein KJO33_04105, partial [Gammaproteobacteria bacterium]|nr:hypothetical protein [Gammaproteobacteria bacterium]